MFQSCLAQLVLQCLFSAHDSPRQENQDLNLWTPWKAYSPFFLSIICLFSFFKAISGSVSARRVTQTDGRAITWLYNPINGPPDLHFWRPWKETLQQRDVLHIKNNTSHEEKNNISSKMIADTNQKVLKTSKASWRVSTNTPSSARGEYGRLVVKDNKWAHWTTTVASAPLLSKCGPHSKPEESSMALIKQLPCHGANSTFESCWPAGWTILENKLDPSVPERWPTAAGWGRFPGIYPQKSLEQMVPFRKPSITALKSRISRCSGGGLCPKGETPDPESPLNRPIWLKGRRFRHGSRGLMQ